MSEAYLRQELERVDGSEFPKRGPVCPKCKGHVPQFANLEKEDEDRVRKLILDKRLVSAMDKLQAATGCNKRWAKIWVLHQGGPPWPKGPAPTPCSYCGKALRTDRAKQCRHCGRDWHETVQLAI